MERQGIEPVKRVAYFEYDFAKDGGAIGDIELRGDALPEGAIVVDGLVHVKTACTSGGSATVALKLLSAADVMAATAVASLSLNAIIATKPVGTAASAILNTTAGIGLTATVAVAALTAGKIVVALEYFA